jgi:hypothetical protein
MKRSKVAVATHAKKSSHRPSANNPWNFHGLACGVLMILLLQHALLMDPEFSLFQQVGFKQ